MKLKKKNTEELKIEHHDWDKRNFIPGGNALRSCPMMYRVGFVPCKLEQTEDGIKVWVLN